MKKILIVDDDRDVFESMKIVLEAEGYGVDWATNGAEAITKARSLKPDLMILDVMMNTDDEGFQVTYTDEAGPPALLHPHCHGHKRRRAHRLLFRPQER